MDIKKIVSIEDLNRVSSNKEVKALILKNNISDKDVMYDNWYVLNSFVEDYVECNLSKSPDCKQLIPGYKDVLIFKNNKFYINKEKCEHAEMLDPLIKLKENTLYSTLPLDSFTISPSKFIDDQNSLDSEDFINKKNIIAKFIDIEKNKKNKGMYIWGKPGIGKTFISKIGLNYFTKRDYKCVFINTINLIEIVKNSFSSQENFSGVDIISKAKKADVLFLDDIGGEPVTQWSRDELMFNILNDRMEKKKITFFTSNFSINELTNQYNIKPTSYQKDGSKEFEVKKTYRFMDRIKALSAEVELVAKNKRY